MLDPIAGEAHHAAPMSEPKSGLTAPLAIAAVLSLLVNGLRLYGELEQWDVPFLGKNLFSTEAGGGGSMLGITWLVPVFGFWFGRRLARGGHGPTNPIGKTLLLHLLGAALTFGVMGLVLGAKLFEDWKVAGYVTFGCGVLFGLFALKAWPRAYLIHLAYGVLARAPVVLIQFVAIKKGWDTHFSKAHPDLPKDPDSTLLALTLAQTTFWPLTFTVLVGGIFATIGAKTVRQG